MLLFRLATKEQDAQQEIPRNVLALLENSAKLVNEKTTVISNDIIRIQNDLAKASGGEQKLAATLQSICNSTDPKYSGVKYQAAFMFGLTLEPIFKLEDGVRTLSDSFREEVRSLLTDPALAEAAIKSSEMWFGAKGLPPSVVLKPQKSAVRDRSGMSILPGISQVGHGYSGGGEFYRDLNPRAIQAFPIELAIPTFLDVSEGTPGSGVFLSEIFNKSQPYVGRVLTYQEFSEYQTIISTGYDAWANSKDYDETGTLKPVSEIIKSSLKPGFTYSDFENTFKSTGIGQALAMLREDSILGASFGDKTRYGASTAFISGQEMANLVDHAITYGLVITKNLTKNGRFGVALYFDHGVVTLAKNSGLENLDYTITGARALLNIGPVNVTVSEPSMKVGGGIAGVHINRAGGFKSHPKLIDAIRVDAGTNLEYPVSKIITYALYGKYELISYPSTNLPQPLSFYDVDVGGRVTARMPTQFVDIEVYGGSSYSFHAEQKARLAGGIGLTNVSIGPGQVSLQLDASIPIGSSTGSQFMNPANPPSMGLRLNYRF